MNPGIVSGEPASTVVGCVFIGLDRGICRSEFGDEG